jgi:ribosomal protein L18E
MPDSSPATSPAGELLRERDRVVGRLRSMALDAIPAIQIRRVAQQLEDLAAAARQEAARPVPELAPYAAADQVTVLVGEVLAAAAQDPAVVTAATGVLVDFRHALAAT